MCCLQEVAVGGDLAAAQAASKHAEAHPHSDSSSNSSTDLPDPSGSAGSHENGLTSAHSGHQGGLTSANLLGTSRPKTPMSPQPDRHPHPVLTRRFSKSAPNSPKSSSNISFQATQDSTSKVTTADAHAQQQPAERRALPGSILIPGRALGSVKEGSGSVIAGSEGGVEGISPPDGYMADSEHSWSRHRLQSSSVSFNDSGMTNHHDMLSWPCDSAGMWCRYSCTEPTQCCAATNNQSVSQSINQSIDRSINQSISKSINQSINKINKKINQPINQSKKNHSTNQSIKQSSSQ